MVEEVMSAMMGKVAARMPSVLQGGFERVIFEEDGDETEEVWVLRREFAMENVPPESDGPLYQEGYIVITPMRLGEVDLDGVSELNDHLEDIPSWESDE